MDNIIKFSVTTPVSLPTNPPKLNSILFKKNSFTTLFGNSHPNNSPNKVPKRVPNNRIRNINPKLLLFIKITNLYVHVIILRKTIMINHPLNNTPGYVNRNNWKKY